MLVSEFEGKRKAGEAREPEQDMLLGAMLGAFVREVMESGMGLSDDDLCHNVDDMLTCEEFARFNLVNPVLNTDEVVDGVSLGTCSSLDVRAPLSQQVRDVDYSYQLRSNIVLAQLRVTVAAGHNGALVGRSGPGKHSSEEGSLDLCMRHLHGG